MINDAARDADLGTPGRAEMALPDRTAPALLASLVLHVILLTSAGFWWSATASGTAAPADRSVGIAIVHRLPDRDRYVDAAQLTPPQPSETTQSAESSAAAAAPPAGLTPPLDLPGVLRALQSTPSPVAGSGLAGDTQLDGDAFGTGSGTAASTDGSETTTVVFGVSGSGSRFVYVFDRSDSMNGFDGKPLRAAKAELIRSLRTLTDRQQFQLVFYNEKPTPFRVAGLPLQMVSGEPSLVAAAESYVRSVAAFGGTEHDEALKLALRMGPDVIFFLTDARIPRLSQPQLHEIQRRAQQSGTTIHAIEFGPDPGAPQESFLRELAAMNGGQYQYVDLRALDAR